MSTISVTDEEAKIFQINSKPNILCTLMGDVKEWHMMYTHMLKEVSSHTVLLFYFEEKNEVALIL